jgi:predicted nucleic acid-binding protein
MAGRTPTTGPGSFLGGSGGGHARSRDGGERGAGGGASSALSLIYVDTSALVRAYLVDESDHEPLRYRLLEADEPVVTSELTRVELASAVMAAARQGRLARPEVVLNRFDTDCADDGPVALLRLDPAPVLQLARELVRGHSIRTLDAIHLAVARTTAAELAAEEPLIMVTRDDRQAEVARALGLETA